MGQRPDQGCTLLPGQNEANVRQNLKGNTRPGAPKWSGHTYASYERPIGDSLVIGLVGNLQYKSRTILSATNPTATYKPYVTFDANVHVGSSDGKWQVAVISKNLNDELAIRGAGNVPGTGGNTGTAEGFGGDQSGGAIRGRQVELEVQ